MNGICLFEKNSPNNKFNIEGDIKFTQCCNKHATKVYINLKGFKPNSTHAIHIHEFGDTRNGCMSLGGHYNPFNSTHGSYRIQGINRHAGDLINNITSDNNGIVNIAFEDNLVSLFPPYSVFGRSVVIHEKQDDLGLGGNKDSLITGNAGGRMACSIIGVSNPL